MIFGIQSGALTLLGTQIHNLSDVFLALSSNIQTITTQEVGCALATQNLTAAQYAQMTSALSLEGETTTLTAAKVQEAAATAGLTSEQASAIVSTLGLSTAQKGLAISAIAAKAGITALNAALGLGLGVLILGISKAVSKLSDKIYDITHKNEILQQSIKDLNSETETIKTDLDLLNDQLKTTQQRLDELSSIDNISVVDQLETAQLKQQNDLLEAKIALKQRELDFKNEETNKTIEDWYKESWQKDIYGSMSYDANNPSVNGYQQKTEEQYFEEQLARADELYKRQQELDNYKMSLSHDEISVMTKDQLLSLELSEQEKQELADIQQYITETTDKLNQQVTGYTAVTDEQKQMRNLWDDIIVRAAKYSSYSNWQRNDKSQNNTFATVDEMEVSTIADKISSAYDDIDNFQTRISEILSKIHSEANMTSTDIINLMQNVAEWGISFDWEKFGVTGESGVGDLKSALIELSDILTDQINDKYPELSAQLAAISKDALASAKGFETFGNALQTLSDHHSLLDNVADAIKETGSISADIANEIITAYPQMQDALYDYLSGVKSAEDVYNELESVYQNDIDSYYQLILQKKELDYSFYEQVYENLPSWVQSYLDAYQKDFGNFKNLAEAKLKLQEQFLKLEEQTQLTDNWALDLRVNAIKEREKIQEILDTINSVELDVSGIKAPTFSKDTESSSKNDSVSIQEIDWAAHSIDNVTHHIDYLNKALDNSNSYKQRDSYLKQLISSQNLYNDSLAKQAKLYRDEYLAIVSSIPQYRKLIESGSTFKIEEFVEQDELYDTITKAQDLYTSWRDINTAQQDAIKSLKEYQEQVDDNWIEYLTSKISLVQNEIDNIEGDIDVNTEFRVVGNNKDIINDWKKEKYEQLLELSSEMQSILESKLINYQRRLNKVQPDTDEYYELHESISETEQAIKDCTKSQREYNSAILSLPLEQYQKQLDLINKQVDILNKMKDKYADYIGAVTYSIDEEIKSITDSKESLEKYYDSLIEPIQNQLDTLQQTNDERERALALQKAYYDLAKAQNNLSVKTYVEGQGFVYRPDENAIREAQDTLDTALYNKAVSELEAQINSYEKTRDALLKDYDKELNRLNDLKDYWSEIISRIESLAIINEFKLKFGDSTLTRIIDGTDTSTIRNIEEWVLAVQSELDTLNIEKGNLEDVIDTCELVVKSYEDGSIDIDTAMHKIDSVVEQYTQSITSLNQEHIESVIDLSSQYKDSLFNFGASEEELSDSTEDSHNQIRSAIAKACTQIKKTYTSLSSFMSSFRSDMISDIRSIGDAASKMANDIASSASNANSALGSINTNPPAQETPTKTATIGTVIATGLATVIGLLFKHDGMESGLVAKDQSEANRDSIFKRIALDDLKANEVPAVLQVGEAVLTKKQQNNVVHNMIAGVDYGMKAAQGINRNSSVNINIPEIHVHEVQNADALAREITRSFKTRMMQEVRK